MPRIELETIINSSNIEIVFDLSRSIDLHKISTEKTKEEAIYGITSGLISLNESVTWKARHLGFYQELTSKITDFKYPIFFADEMTKGVFKKFRHEHHFTENNGVIVLTDIFDYQSPFGFFGKLIDVVFLKNYMKKFLKERNKVIKNYAETNMWKSVLK